MRKLTLPVTLVTSLLALPAIGQSPIAKIPPGAQLDPLFNSTIVNTNFAGHTIGKIHSAELKHVGGGIYRAALCVQAIDPVTFATNTWTDLLTGLLDLSQSTPVWTPDNNMALVNLPGTTISQFQLSLSDDGLVASWDSYTVVSYTTSAGLQSGQTFVCKRANAAAPFQVADVRAVQGVSAGGVDPHIGGTLSNGNVWFLHIDFTVVNGSLNGSELDPLTGALSNTWQVLNRAVAGGFYHSGRFLSDSTGAPRAITCSDYPATGAFSNFMLSEGVRNDGTLEQLVDGSAAGPIGAASWINNPAVVGGSLRMCTDGAQGEWLLNATVLANASRDSSGNARVVCWSPTEPTLPISSYLSAVGFDFSLLPTPIPLPVFTVGDLYVAGLIFSPIILHDQHTGVGEWPIFGLPSGPGITLESQLFTMNLVSGEVYASNTAKFNF